MNKYLKEFIDQIIREVSEYSLHHLDDDDTELEIIGDVNEWHALLEYIEKVEKEGK